VVSARDEAWLVGASFSAPEVFLLAKVEWAPVTPRGSAFLFCEKTPCALVDSAARESEAMEPGFSVMGGARVSCTWGWLVSEGFDGGEGEWMHV